MANPVAPTPRPHGNAGPGQDPTVPADKVQEWGVASGWHVAGTSRMGSTRQVNEDQLLVVPPRGTRPWLVAVADGVGGEAAGEVASAAAMHALQATWIATYTEPLDTASADQTVRDALLAACTAADEAVAVIQRDPATRGAATTLTALATWPRYDPSAFETGEGVSALLTDTRLPLLNRPVQGLYPAGSIFKVVTMAAALEHGVATPDSEFTCTGTWTGLPGVSQRCWLATGHGTITLANGLTQSCNSVFYELGKRLQEIGAPLLPDSARGAGLGGTSGLMGGDEPSGLVPDPVWKRASLAQPWTPGDTVNLAIGQGQLLVTPLQMALVYAMIATGKPVMPTILAATSLPGGNVEQALPSPTPGASRKAWGASILAPMRSALRDVVGTREGTASAIFAGSPLARIVSGKTGTAETQPGKPTHAWFAGYGPPDSVAIVTMVEYGGEGSRVATPIARKVFEAVLG